MMVGQLGLGVPGQRMVSSVRAHVLLRQQDGRIGGPLYQRECMYVGW